VWRINGRGRAFGDAHKNGHGWVDLKQSIAQSVNTYYYQLAMDMGVARFDEYMSKYGFGKPSGIDLVGETSGILPSPEYKMKRWKQPWYAGDLANSGIGQGLWKVDMLQLASAVGGLANNGAKHRLHLVRATRQGYAAPWVPQAQPPAVSMSDNQQHIAAIKDAMVAVVHGPTGTARAIGINAPYIMGGKTGTAQVVSNKNNLRLDPHSLPLNLRHQSLFIAFAPAEAPRIAVAVVVEHGGFGASAAAPIARQIMDAWLVPNLVPPGGLVPVPADGTASTPVFATAPGTAHPPRPASPPPRTQPMAPPPEQLLPPPDQGDDDDTGTVPR
jgi:penicillin-binding protein 2